MSKTAISFKPLLGEVLPLSHLPNKEGFKFIGINSDNGLEFCIVKKDKNGCHFIDNFKNKKGWRRI